MSKVLDWSKTYKPSSLETRETYRGRVQDQLKKAEEDGKRQALIKAQEPILKEQLLDRMINRRPIKVMYPFYNATEALGGVVKSEEEDNFYYTGGANAGASPNATFQEVMETIPAGIELVYKSMNKTLQQWIFGGSNGKEYAIYFNDTIMFQQKYTKNPGLTGLLFNTDVSQNLGE